jgi:hypothetical protein
VFTVGLTDLVPVRLTAPPLPLAPPLTFPLEGVRSASVSRLMVNFFAVLSDFFAAPVRGRFAAMS